MSKIPIPSLILEIFASAHIPSSDLTLSPSPSASSSSSSLVTRKSTSETFFIKTQSDVVQMRGEVEGLRAMNLTAPGLVPRVIGFKVKDGGREGGMVSQYFDLTSSRGSASQKELGRKLAEMHRPPPPVPRPPSSSDSEPISEGGRNKEEEQEQEQEEEEKGAAEAEGYTGKYGFAVPTHCGVTQQDNTWEESWEVFFTHRRLGDLVRRIGDKQVSQAWEGLKSKAVPLLLGKFDPPARPVILHGDLWSGNAGYDRTTSSAVIYDPASYYGHNEADLGITHMFGGFSQDFYEEYHKTHPRSEPFYDQRQKLYELYHHLNHTLMFGGGYKSGALGIMRSLTGWAEGVEHEVS